MPQSSQVYGSIVNSPRNESVLVSAPVGHEKSHAPQPMHASSTTLKLTTRLPHDGRADVLRVEVPQLAHAVPVDPRRDVDGALGRGGEAVAVAGPLPPAVGQVERTGD